MSLKISKKKTIPPKEHSTLNQISRRQRLEFEQTIYQGIQVADLSTTKSRFYFLLASLYWTLASRYGKKEIVFGIPILNRRTEEEKNTIGYFIGLIPLRLSFGSTLSFERLVLSIKDVFGRSRASRGVAIHEINKEVGVNFSNERQLYDVVFSFEEHSYDHPFGEFEVTEAGTFSSDFEQNPLVVHVQHFTEKTPVYIEFDYNLNFLNDEEVISLKQSYLNTINSFYGNEHKRLSRSKLFID